jgi:hypothetical protein
MNGKAGWLAISLHFFVCSLVYVQQLVLAGLKSFAS